MTLSFESLFTDCKDSSMKKIVKDSGLYSASISLAFAPKNKQKCANFTGKKSTEKEMERKRNQVRAI